MSDNWTDEELEVAVRQYWKAVKNGDTERQIDRSAFIKGALRDGLKARGEGSVLRRMGNISAVLEAHDRVAVIGWKAQPHVGSGVVPRLEAILTKFDLI